MNKKSSGDCITLMAVGDIMLGDHPMRIGHGVGSKIKQKGSQNIFQHVREVLNDADITFGNLEAVLSNKNLDSKSLRSVQLRGNPNSVEGLIHTGFNVLSLANNHAMEHGREALKETLEILSRNNIYYIPTDKYKNHQEPVVIEVKKIKIGFLGYCLVTDDTTFGINRNSSNILNDVRHAKKQCDFVILSLHWGHEYIEYPSSKQIQLAHEFVDAGANIVLGHHPHVLQGIEIYKGGVIAYSLGNFVFDMWQEKMRMSVILRCVISRTGTIDTEVIPIFINRNYQPTILQGQIAKKFLIKMDKLSSLLKENMSTENYEIKAKNCVSSYRKDIRKYFLKNFYRYPPVLALQIMENYIKKYFRRLKP